MFSNASHLMFNGGTFNSTSITQTNATSRGMDRLLEWVATGAFHNSDELDGPKCHPHTSDAVLHDIMQWVNESESAQNVFMMWFFGPAGAGKSAIAKKIAEIAADMGILIATFFFSRTSSERSNKDRLVATLAYQLALSIPDTRPYIENAIEQDPTIFKKNVQTQVDTLLINPFQSVSSNQVTPSNKLIIIDGLDECDDSRAQVAILRAISRSFSQHSLSVKFLVVSRPEPDLDTSFNCDEPLRFIHRRLALDSKYWPAAVPLLRAYGYGDHFYTTDSGELKNAITQLGYSDEGTTGYVFSDQQPHTVPLYRLYNGAIQNHFYTTNAAERDNAASNLGYNKEGITGYVYPDIACGGLELYRLHSGGQADHFYTMSAAERDNASKNLGYTQEGVAGYILPFCHSPRLVDE